MKAYKGFNSKLQCRDFQYNIGASYVTDIEPELCKWGFHACKNPIEVLLFYAPIENTKNRYCIVDVDGKIVEHDAISKIAGQKITINEELDYNTLTKHIIEHSKEYETVKCQVYGQPYTYMASYHANQVLSGNSDHNTRAGHGVRSISAVSENYGCAYNEARASISAITAHYSVALVNGRDSIAASTGHNCLVIANDGIAVGTGTGSVIQSNCKNGIAVASNTGSLAEITNEQSVALSNTFGISKACSANSAAITNNGFAETANTNSVAIAINQGAVKGILNSTLVFINGNQVVTKIVDGVEVLPDTYYIWHEGQLKKAYQDD